VARLNTLRLRLALALFLVAAAALGVHAGLTRWPLPQFLATLQAGNPAPIVAPAGAVNDTWRSTQRGSAPGAASGGTGY